ncbi:MAG TPA: peptidoglycan DD-metalloendopeptidase family protein, partial [Actinomycetota bacterium]|nr:peptidoglycan DD-metalloendopeptidase family protein [Actinomycetota bacterium]
GGSGGGGGDDSDGSGSGGDGDNKDGKTVDGKKGDGKKGEGRGDGKGKGKNKKKKKKVSVIPPTGTPDIPGSFNTEKLMSMAAHLRSLGWSAEEVIAKVFPPFIIAGEATWIDTWGVPRYGPGPIVRTHEGQDVFCDYGDPVLAPEAGYVSFSDGGLGGITARVHTGDGAYWYLTHLSDLNTEELSPGDTVEAGTVVGFCGNSGNAATTPPHVHFGWYQASGEAKNPMRHLVQWLRIAEDNSSRLIVAVQDKRQKQLPALTAARRFGDAFTPDRSFLPGGAGESLWASGSSPATGTFALAEAALQAALAERLDAPSSVSVPTSEGAGTTGGLDPESQLAKLLKHTQEIHEAGD